MCEGFAVFFNSLESSEVVNGHPDVVGEGSRVGTLCVGEGGEEGVDSEGKEEGTEGAALFHSDFNVETVFAVPIYLNISFNVCEEVVDEVDVVFGGAYVFEDLYEVVVVDGVKSFFKIKEE